MSDDALQRIRRKFKSSKWVITDMRIVDGKEVWTITEGEQHAEEGKVPAQSDAACPQIQAAENEGLPPQ